MFRFADKAAFFYLWLIPVVIILGVWLSARSRKLVEKNLGSRLTPYLVSSVSRSKRRWKFILEALTILFFVIALARPQMGSSLQEIKSEGIEIVIALDVSKSMMAEDNRPNRLEVVKIELKKLLDRFSGDKVGLVVFAGSSFLASPLTTDYSAIKMYLDSITTDSVSSQGTEIKPALEEAMTAFQHGGVDPEEQVAVTRIILVASDGEDHDKGALAYAQKLAQQGVRIFALGAGTVQGAPIPLRDDFGYLKGHQKDDKGQIVMSTHKGEFLTELAQSTGGGYYHVDGGAAQMDQLKAQFDRFQKAQFESQMATEYDERFQIFLLLGLLFGFLEFFLSERTSRYSSFRWRSRVAGLGSQTTISSVVFLLLFSLPAFGTDILTPEIIRKNNEAATLLEQEKFSEAYRATTEALGQAPFQPEVRLNLGLAFEKNGENEKAVKEYLAVAKDEKVDSQRRFEAYFNAARVSGDLKKVPQAIELYQQALAINPESVEAKTNIELLLQQQSGGGGKDDQDKKQDEKDQKDKQDQKGGKPNEPKDDKKDGQKDAPGQPQPPSPQQGKQKPRPFKSEELSENDVKNILEELKRQEQKNRAKMQEKQMDESSGGPEW
ncbi:MAG: VWA domain-containing protein [Bdellovibrionales bacterium]